MPTLRFKGRKSNLQFSATYNEVGECTKVSFLNIEIWNDTQKDYFVGNVMPILMQHRTDALTKISKAVFEIDTEPDNLTFAAFWNEYGNKIGNKSRAEGLWKQLSDEERAGALLGIKKYKKWLGLNPSVQTLYPETFLNQRRWENEY